VYIDVPLAMERACERAFCSAVIPTGRRGIDIVGGIAPLGSGGRGECVEVEMEAGDLSDAVMTGGFGNTFENLDRPLPGVSGRIEDISNRPARALNKKQANNV
jgi:hypothetical protein